MKISKLFKKLKTAYYRSRYVKYLKKHIDEHAVLLEAGQGEHINGNVFAFLRSIETQQKWKCCVPYVSVTEKTKTAIDKKLKGYGFKKYVLVYRKSKRYRKMLATAKYLITDNSFPPYMVKRDEQVYLNTWHGTPLKQLGRRDIDNSTSIGNVQKNFLSADYLLFPNTYTRDIMMSDYMIDRLFKNKAIITDYPRNDALFNRAMSEKLKAEYNPEGKRIIAYMPTWRGLGRNADTTAQIREAEGIIKDIEKGLNEDEVLYVNFHFLIGNQIDFSSYEKVNAFPEEYETYEFLNICDVLITDYSSVMFDFAQTGRGVVMYIYDYEKYKEEKGFYFDITELPFPKPNTVPELLRVLHEPLEQYHLDRKFTGRDFGHATEKVMDLIFKNIASNLDITDYNYSKGTKYVLFESPRNPLHRQIAEKYMNSLSPEEKKKTVIAFVGAMKGGNIEFLKAMDKDLEFLRVMSGGSKSLTEYAFGFKQKKFGGAEKHLEKFCDREYERLIKYIGADEVSVLIANRYERLMACARFSGRTAIHEFPPYFYSMVNKTFHRDRPSKRNVFTKFDEVIEHEIEDETSYWEGTSCTGITAQLSSVSYHVSDDVFEIKSKLLLESMEKAIDSIDAAVIAGNEYPIEVNHVKGRTDKGVYKYKKKIKISIPVAEINGWEFHNRLLLKLRLGGKSILVFTLSPRPRRRFKKLIYPVDRFDEVCFFKEGVKYFTVTVRNRNHTDSGFVRFKIAVAFICHLLTFWHKPVLMYEKDCSRYEESASLLLERMVDKGYKNMNYILAKGYPYREKIPEKCLPYLVDRFSFKHFYKLFASKSIIASEAIAHSLEPRTVSKLFRPFIQHGRKNYVFLQHGVMYMISLSSEQRAFFNKGAGRGLQRVVVSSELEANHFIQNTGYEPEDMYISGLPKFDTSYCREDADRIIVMLTWRPWEYVNGMNNFFETGYYKMLKRIVDSVPDEFKDKLIVLPHPLIADLVELNSRDAVWRYAVRDTRYDEILRSGRVLITDYSSIAYDAFYRGMNVIFCWEEKDECMEQYGSNAKLMLTEELAFGPVCYRCSDIGELIKTVYDSRQSEKFLDNYNRIVKYNDGKNTERLINMLEKDRII